MLDYQIKPIEHQLAMDVIVKKHYLHRKPPCSYSFGLFDGNNLLGVICYGTPSSSSLRQGICGPEEKLNVIELNRLWVDDSAQKFAESYLIAHTLRLVDKEIIVSFADTAQEHLGIVYQATNFIYTGLSAKRTDYHVEGIALHGQTIADKFTSKELRNMYGDRFSLQPRSRKHRYVFFNCGPRRRKYLISQLRYPILPYPKKEA